MNENTTKPTKKKRLLQVLIFAACLLIIAAITVGVVFAVRGNTQNLVADNNQQQGEQGNSGNQNTPGGQEDNNDKDNDDKETGGQGGTVDTSSQYEFIMPVKTVEVSKNNEFNWDNTMKWYRLHQAVDFAAPAGTEVLAAVDGTVKSIETELDAVSVTIEHANGITTVYKFVEPYEIAAGSKVSRGQVIGKVAPATGVEAADGDHLHFEVYKDGKLQDPEDYLDFQSK